MEMWRSNNFLLLKWAIHNISVMSKIKIKAFLLWGVRKGWTVFSRSHLHWLLIKQCAASSFKEWTSNNTLWNSRSWAVGLVLASVRTHDWINSCQCKWWRHLIKPKKKMNRAVLVILLMSFTLMRGSSSNCPAWSMASLETAVSPLAWISSTAI